MSDKASEPKEFYTVCYHNTERDDYVYLILKANSHFEAERKAEAELKRWRGHTLHSVSWADKNKIESGEPVFIGDLIAPPAPDVHAEIAATLKEAESALWVMVATMPEGKLRQDAARIHGRVRDAFRKLQAGPLEPPQAGEKSDKD